jgi:predicted 3-demethylubiquinone-9 3-methyltransferase (glyoxalase superfamily)
MAHIITPFLMFEGTAEKAMQFYVSLFDDAGIVSVEHWGAHDVGAQGKVKKAQFTLCGRPFYCSDSPIEHAFTFTPSLSLFVDLDSEASLERTFSQLMDGGKVLMPLDDYGFSKKFGWVNDRFGVSWQLNLPQ